MNLLADTHVLIWMLRKPGELEASAEKAILEPANTVFFSHVSVWEIEIKVALGKLSLPADWIEKMAFFGFNELPIHLEEIRASAQLPLHHRDPFDRLLVAQAKCHRFTLVTRDLLLARYEVQILPA